MAYIERRSIVYVGGVDHSIGEDTLFTAFIPFGEIKSIQLPLDANTSKQFVICFS
jgi:RNA recognition motif-containing protein